jgi:hydrogenase maturation factor HypF (carbamoyltransferase family)
MLFSPSKERLSKQNNIKGSVKNLADYLEVRFNENKSKIKEIHDFPR